MKELIITIIASLVALTLALMSGDPSGPALAFGVAALGSCPHPLAAGWAALGASLAVGQIVPVPLDPIGAAGMVSIGFVCAALTRALCGSRGLLAAARSELVLVLSALVVFVLLYLPDGRALLETQDGQALYVTAFAQELADGVRVETVFRASAEVSLVSPAIVVALASALGAALFIVLVGSMRTNREIERLGWTLALVSGCAVAMLGFVGQVLLVGTSVELADVYGDWQALAELSTSGLVLDHVEYPSSGYVGYSSRPAVDILRLVSGVALAWLAFRELRRRSPRTMADQIGRARPEILVAALLLFASLVFFQHRGGVFYVLSATVLLTLMAGFLGRQASTSHIIPQSLIFGALCLSVLTIVGPAAGWVLIG